jgi:hypothetical protein
MVKQLLETAYGVCMESEIIIKSVWLQIKHVS